MTTDDHNSDKFDGLLIGLTGVAGVGKTTTAEAVVQITGGTVLRLSEPLKWFAEGFALRYGNQRHRRNSATDAETKDKVIPSLGVSMRDLQIGLGEGMRSIMPDFWVNILRTKLLNTGDRTAGTTFPVTVVDDIRRQNEYDLIHSLGGVVVDIQHSHKDDEPEFSPPDIEITAGYDLHVYRRRSPLATASLVIHRAVEYKERQAK